jgi:hypothetical protein
MLDVEWNQTDVLEEHAEVAELGIMCVVAFLLVPRGNEVMIVHVGVLWNTWKCPPPSILTCHMWSWLSKECSRET